MSTPPEPTTTAAASAKLARRWNDARRPISRIRIRAAVTAGLVLASVATAGGSARAEDPLGRPSSSDDGEACAGGYAASDLHGFFSGEYAGITGADHQRATKLPDGRVLWMFQDVFVKVDPPPTPPTTPGDPTPPPETTKLVHNAGLVQSGRCFTPLIGPNDTEWILAGRTTAQQHWFWPMGGAYNLHNGTFDLMMAEMVERGPTYLSKTEPVATWRVSIRISDMKVVSTRRAPNRSADLYGWSVASDASHTYLYSHCYRQFGWGWLGYDKSCASHVRVGRVPKGRLDLAPEYWDGYRWVRKSSAAVDVFPTAGRDVNPVQVMYIGTQWVAITKPNDWWGKRILVESAPAPTGPWRVMSDISAQTRCGSACNTYFASWVPWTDSNGSMIAAISNNRWDGVASPMYRPTVFNVPRPPAPIAQTVQGPIAPSTPARFVPLTPCRLLDTRTSGPSPYPARRTLGVQAVGRCGVPADATAIATTAVAVQPRGDGHLSIWPRGTSIPTVASLNYRTGEVRANSAIVRLGQGGFNIQSHAASDIVVDVTGAWVPASTASEGRFVPVTPRRMRDTRARGDRLGAGQTMTLRVPSGVPGDATALALNLTMVNTDGPGHLTAWPGGSPMPLAASMNADRAGQVRGGSVIVPISPEGVKIYTEVGTDLVVDVTGYVTGPSAGPSSAGLFVADQPTRIIDTRQLFAPLAAGEARRVNTGAPGSAVAINVASVLPARAGHITVFPSGTGLPNTSSLNFGDESAVANAAQIAQTNGKLDVSNIAGGDLVIDRVGWFL